MPKDDLLEQLQQSLEKIKATTPAGTTPVIPQTLQQVATALGKQSLINSTMGSSQPTATTKNEEYFAVPKYRATQGKLIYGVRMENTDPGHFKEYTVTVTAVPLAGASAGSGANEYIVEGAWGKINGGLSSQVKDIDGKRSTSNKTRAIEAAKDLERAKKAKGYSESLKIEEDQAALEEEIESLDWTVTDDMIVDPMASADAVTKEIDRDCFCMTTVEELAISSYVDPVPADLSIAPLLQDPNFGFVRFDSQKRGARWLVTIQDSCESGYRHARAYPVGEAMSDASLRELKRSTAQFIEDLIIDAVDDRAAKKGGLDLTILVEEKAIDVVVLDALRWEGEDLTELPWAERRRRLDTSFRSVFNPERKSGRHIELAPRVINRLRETYLAEGDRYRFELHPLGGLPGADSWQMPQL